MSKTISTFLTTLQIWYVRNKRTLPFRGEKDPYKIWVSEILLQQTQMSRGILFYNRFIQKFPTVHHLAKSTWEEFFPYFEGLGYYNRGRNMIKASQYIVTVHKGKFPQIKQELTKIPGVGPYTADAILSFAFNYPTIPLDTNIKRILGRIFLGKPVLESISIGHSGLTRIKKGIDSRLRVTDNIGTKETKLLQQITKAYATFSSSDLNQAMMDFCSRICFMTKPLCLECPLQQQCLYFKKEQPHIVETKKVKKEVWTKKYVIGEIYVTHKRSEEPLHVIKGILKEGNERTFLKQQAKQKIYLTISVRPAYKTWIKNQTKYSLHRCYILL